MNLQTLSNTKGATKNRKRLGRGPGSKTGKTSGKGHKGQMARKGNKHKPGFEGGQMRLVRRIPKRGFSNPARKVYVGVNVCQLSRFDADTEVTSAVLIEAGLANGKFDGIKILGRGEIDKKLVVKVAAFSKSAQEKIEAAGGSCEVVRD